MKDRRDKGRYGTADICYALCSFNDETGGMIMLKKKILLVGESMNLDMWEQDLAEQYETHSVTTMMDAIEFLRTDPNAAQYQLFVQDNLPIHRVVPTPPEFPPEFAIDKVRALDRGEALIKYVRANRLIAIETPAYLATVFDGWEKFREKPEGVTKVIRLMDERGIVRQMEPPLFREQDAAQVRRG